MRGISSYILASVAIALAWAFLTPPDGLKPALGSWSSAPVLTEGPMTLQHVDRTHKGDRLKMPSNVGSRRAPQIPAATLVGCEPSFSPLSASATTAGRCIV